MNHDGSVKKAEELVLASKAAGATTVKVQVFSAETLSSKSAPLAPYQAVSTNETSHKSMLAKYELSQDEIHHLFDFALSERLNFLATPYTLEDARFLIGLGLNRVKTASADITDLRMHRYLAEASVDVIMSTGMATDQEVKTAVSAYKASTCELQLLHCVSLYPTSHIDANMKRIPHLKALTGLSVGYSDHTLDSTAALIALALGARKFEKHITLNTGDVGPDHRSSLAPGDFAQYVIDLTNGMHCISKDGSGEVVGDEAAMQTTSRKSLHTARSIAKNELITLSDVTLMRPGDGLSWESLSLLLGKRTVRSMPRGHKISLEDVRD